MELVVRGRRDVKPLLVKLGVALAVSFVGFLVSRAWSRPPSPSRPRCPVTTEAEDDAKAAGGLKDELRIRKSEESLAKIINGTSTTTTRTTTTTTTVVGLSPTSRSSRSSGDEDGFLLPEFNDLVIKEFDATGRDPEAAPSTPVPKKSETRDETAMEQEILHLKNLVSSVRERERSLEFQLLEYYGIQEQQAAMKELENQLKITSMEAKLYSLKVESLLAENRRLQAQASDYSKATGELEGARAKIKLLKKKLRSDGEQAREKIAALHQRISVLQCREQKEDGDDADVERQLKKLKELEDEAKDLRMLNSTLTRENSDLAKKLEARQSLAATVVQGPETKALEDEVNSMREANNKLNDDVEQLRAGHLADVEELVYLKWVNACLRYELRNYQAPQGKTVARDLSKTLSPKSEEKAKQLILEYANLGADEKNASLMDIDSEYSSSSQASTFGEPDDSMDASSPIKHGSSNKLKFFSKLKKLVLGKDNHSNKISAADRTLSGISDKRVSVSTSSADDMMGRDSCHSFSSCMTEDFAPANNLPGVEVQVDEQQQNKETQSQSHRRPSLDIQRLRRLNMEDVEEEKGNGYRNDSPDMYKNMTPGDERLSLFEAAEMPEKVELKKFAAALNKSRRPKRSASFSH